MDKLDCQNIILSIIIPVYNSEKYIRRCLESINRQKNNKNIEIVIINDGSYDKTELIIKEFINSTSLLVNYIFTENNGVSKARNIGLENSKGKYLMFLDSDDYLPDGTTDKMVFIAEHNEVDIVSGIIRMTDSRGKLLNVSYSSESIKMKKDEFLIACLNNDPITFSSCGKIYKKSFISNTRFIEKRRINEDGFFNFELSLKEPVVEFLEEDVYYYTKNLNSSSHDDSIDKYFDILYFANKKYKIIVEDYPQYKELAKNVIYKAHISFLINYAKTNDTKNIDEMKKSINYVKENSLFNSAMSFSEIVVYLFIKLNMYPIFKRLYRIKYLIERIKL